MPLIPQSSFDKCESPLEEVFLNRLYGKRGVSVETQKQCGPYRLDLFANGVGIEIDGKQFHDARRDWARDRWILDHCDVDVIVRFPGAAVKFFLAACQGALAELCPHAFAWFANSPEAYSAEACQEYYDAICERSEWWRINDLYSEEGYGWLTVMGATSMHVGSPLAFVRKIHCQAIKAMDRKYMNLATSVFRVGIQRKTQATN